MSSHFKTVESLSNYNTAGLCYSDGSFNLYFRDVSTPLSDFTAWLEAQINAGTPVQMCYELAAPVTHQLTPQQLATLSGYNAVSTDAGTLSVTYRADISLIHENNTNAILSMGGNVP